MNYSIKEIAKFFFFSLTILVFTFPFIDADMNRGLDMSYMWAFNQFFDHNTQIGRDIFFTYGPLGFLKYPMPIGHNLELGVCIITAIRWFFIISIMHLCLLIRPAQDLWAFAMTYLLCVLYAGVDYLLIGAVAANLLSHRELKKPFYLLLAVLMAVLGLLIKINIGITCVLILGSYCLIDLINNSSVKNIFITASCYVVVLLTIWYFLYHSLSGVLVFVRNLVIISTGNLGATALTVPNNWYILGTAFALLFAFPLIINIRQIRVLAWMLVLAFFAVFRYSFAREENYHVLHLFNFMLLAVAFCIILFKEIKVWHIIWLLTPLMLYNVNMHLTNRYTLNDSVQFVGINNFRKCVLNFKEYKQDMLNVSAEQIRPSKLPRSFMDKIGDKTVDSYPWELSYIAASGLTYCPRPLIQLACVSSPLLDKENAQFIKSDKAAQYILWHNGWCSDRLCSIDERYLLNEDMQTQLAIFSNYKIVDSIADLKLLERREATQTTELKTREVSKYQWQQWIKSPSIDSATVLLAKINIHKSWLGKLKSSFYKEKEYYIEYKLANNSIVKHRFIADNASSGVWVSPYLYHLSPAMGGINVVAIRFTTTDNISILKDGIAIAWFTIKRPRL